MLVVTPLAHDERMGVGEQWRPWRQLRADPSITLVLRDGIPGGLRAIRYEMSGRKVIVIDRNLDPVERLAALAHELVHDERGGSGHRPDLPPALTVLVTREERRVDRIVADRLVPLDRLEDFAARRMTVGPVTPAMVAAEFGVTEEVAAMAMERSRRAG